MDRDAIYTAVQTCFRSGLVTIVGSGVSCGFGLPSMGALAEVLQRDIPEQVRAMSPSTQEAWGAVSARLAEGAGLEVALDASGGDEILAELVATYVAGEVAAAEAKALRDIVSSSVAQPLTRLFRLISQASVATDVITTNYDRLIEYCAGVAQLGVDSMFCGEYVGRLDATASRHQMLIPHVTTRRRNDPTVYRYRKHIRLSKPHGSLDWYEVGGRPIRCDTPLEARRLIIAPGSTKYLAGYDSPFDVHRERANRCIDNATAILSLGFGFNDAHLQTHLKRQIESGTPTVVVARTLTDAAKSYLSLSDSTIGFEALTGAAGTRVHFRGVAHEIRDVGLWQLDDLLREVLKS